MTQEDLLQAAKELSSDELAEFVARVTALQHQREAADISEESQLLTTIHQVLPSDIKERLDLLTEKRQGETLTDEEYEELLGLADRVEEMNLQRVEAMAKLARLRHVDIRTLMQQLDFPIPSYV